MARPSPGARFRRARVDGQLGDVRSGVGGAAGGANGMGADSGAGVGGAIRPYLEIGRPPCGNPHAQFDVAVRKIADG